MRNHLRCAFFVSMLWATPAPSIAQVPQSSLTDPAKTTRSLVFALQTGDQHLLLNWLSSDLIRAIMSRTSNTGLDQKLKELGAVQSIEVVSSDPRRNLSVIKVTHQSAISVWTIIVDPKTERISQASYQVSPGSIPPLVTKQAGAAHSYAHSFARNPASTISGSVVHPNIIATLRPIDHARINPTTDLRNPAPAAIPSVLPAQPTGTATPLDPRVVDFLYATTRKQVPQTTAGTVVKVNYSGDRIEGLNFGIASVRIPEDHKIGRIEIPYVWTLFGLTLEGTTNDKKHFVIREVKPLSQEQWGAVIRSKAAKRAFIFVHGFNTSFQDAVFRTAQIVWDMQYPGLAVLFSWASGGEGGDYIYDQNSAQNARDRFIDVLKMLRETYGIEEVNVIAHSMGNHVVLDALATNSQSTSPIKFSQLVMAAPDVDRDHFKQMIPQIHPLARGMTLYASSADKAMVASRTLAREPRAGDIPPGGPIILPNLDTIDVTAVGDELFGLNHTEFAENRDVIEDIARLIDEGKPPPRLIQVRPFPEAPAQVEYWRYAQ